MLDFTKCWKKLEEINFSTYQNRINKLIPESTMSKLRMLRDESDKKNSKGLPLTISQKLLDYKEKNNKEFQTDISTKTLDSLAQLCQCQPYELFDWIDITLDPKESYSYKIEHNDKT